MTVGAAAAALLLSACNGGPEPSATAVRPTDTETGTATSEEPTPLSASQLCDEALEEKYTADAWRTVSRAVMEQARDFGLSAVELRDAIEADCGQQIEDLPEHIRTAKRRPSPPRPTRDPNADAMLCVLAEQELTSTTGTVLDQMAGGMANDGDEVGRIVHGALTDAIRVCAKAGGPQTLVMLSAYIEYLSDQATFRSSGTGEYARHLVSVVCGGAGAIGEAFDWPDSEPFLTEEAELRCRLAG